jgi:catechol 2,3-dioxygenase
MMMVTLDQTIQLKNIAIVQHLCVLKRRGTSMSENSPLIQPTLQHFGVLTGHLERMVDWYAKVVGMTTRYSTSREVGASVTFLSNDRAHHRLAIITIPELQEDTDKKVHAKLQHVAFEYATIDDLLNSYARIKGLGIEPVLTTDHGPAISFYYKDPDSNIVEVFVDLGNWDTHDFHKNSMGTFVDADKLVAARQGGMSLEELQRRAYAGEFPPPRPMNPRDLT